MTLMEKQDRDYKWFLENYNRLYDQYGETYLAIKDESVLGTYPSYSDAVHKTEKTENLGSFIVQYCNGDKSAYTAYIAPVITVGI